MDMTREELVAANDRLLEKRKEWLANPENTTTSPSSCSTSTSPTWPRWPPPPPPRLLDKTCECGAALEPFWTWNSWVLPARCENCAEESRKVAEAKSAEEAREWREKNAAKLLGDAGLPARYREARLADFPARYRNLQGGLYLTGPAGTGKTRLAAAILRQVLVEEDTGGVFGPQFIEVPELLLDIRGTFRDGSERTEEGLLAEYANSDLLILDDLGAEKPTEWVTQTLYLLINRRYGSEKRTIITSNLGLSELGNRLGDRIVSRVAGMCQVVELTGKDRRLHRVK